MSALTLHHHLWDTVSVALASCIQKRVPLTQLLHPASPVHHPDVGVCVCGARGWGGVGWEWLEVMGREGERLLRLALGLFNWELAKSNQAIL